MAEKEVVLEIKRPELIVLTAFLIAIFYLEFQVSISSPIAFGDEGYHTRMAQYFAQTTDYPVWVPFEGTKLIREGFWRPPAWNILEGSFYYLFGFNTGIVKFLTPFIATILTGFLVFVLVKKIYNANMGLMAAIIAVTIPSVVTYAVLFYTDTMFTFYFVAFVLTLILTFETESKKYAILSGVFAAFSFMTKSPGVVVYPMVVILLLYSLLKEKKKLMYLVKLYLPIFVIALLIVGPFSLRLYRYYKNPFCYLSPVDKIFGADRCHMNNFKETLQFEGRTQQTGSEQGLLQVGLQNYFDFAYGNVWFIGLGFFAGLLLSIYQKKKADLVIIVSLLMLLLVFYQSTVRIEDTARYTLGWAPIVALIAGRYFSEVFDFIKKYQKYLALIVFVFVIVMAYLNFNAKISAMKTVKQFSPAFFQACDWVKSNPNQVPVNSTIITVWVHHTTFNCQRNTVGNMADVSVSSDVGHILDTARVNGIDFIFVQKFSLSDQYLSESYNVNFIQILENNPKNFVKIYESGDDWNTCIRSGGCDGAAIYKIVF
ncbi:MAG: glycosyltransferase family 39 protein [Candidatus Aenigmarchaeota archaeon]|nr:glycosyltransferase family 39 protein [Candidatus Aenigmarchaeota archaeon]